jgi:hypothetical protein
MKISINIIMVKFFKTNNAKLFEGKLKNKSMKKN